MESTPTPLPASLEVPALKGTTFRILVPWERTEVGAGIFRFALALARSFGGEILVLHVVKEDEREEAAGWTLPHSHQERLEQVPHRLLTFRAASVAAGIVQVAEEEECAIILLSWRGQPRAMRNRLGHILDPVIDEAPCDVAVVKGGYEYQEEETPRRLLVASAGGPNAAAAARLAVALARDAGARVTFLTVLPMEPDPDREEELLMALDELIATVGLTPEEAERLTDKQLVYQEDVEEAILSAAKEHDMVFLGATRVTVLSQLLLGSVVERMAQNIPVPVVIVKRYGGVTRFWLRRVWKRLDRALPDVPTEERLDTYKRVRRGARATSDFYILIVLSVVIATMGLLLNSGAVIIGAMLVAPLMTPILGLGLGVVMGDIRLLRVAGESTVFGVLLAIVVSAILAWLAPLALFTTEVQSRVQPNLFDLTVALAAGAAGAYSVSRKSVAAALPGVAIAAALVPPLGVVGISLATARWGAVMGSLLLFGTNLVAISLSAAVTYVLLGFFPEEDEQGRVKVLRRGFLIILALLFAVSIPLARTLAQEATDNALDNALRDSVQNALKDESDLSLFSVDWEREYTRSDPIPVQVVVYAARDVTGEMRQEIDEVVGEAIGRDVQLRLIVIPISDLREVSEEAPEVSEVQ